MLGELGNTRVQLECTGVELRWNSGVLGVSWNLPGVDWGLLEGSWSTLELNQA